MFGLFKCKHPANFLHVKKDSTEENTEHSEYKKVTYHLYCMSCGKDIKIKYARYINNLQ